jgi:hypothetical protein
MSARGALIDDTDLCLACGTPLMVSLCVSPGSDPVPVVGEVVSRERPRSMAVEFRPLDPTKLRLLSIVLTTLGMPVAGRVEDRSA